MNNKTVFLAGLFHETHTFLSEKTDLDDFQRGSLHVGQAVILENRGNDSPTDGFLEYAEAKNWNIIPSIQMAANPSGCVTEKAIKYFECEFFDCLDQWLNNLSGIFLVLHGAMVSEVSDDVEGDILAKIKYVLRQRGVDIPVVAVIDFHANVSQKMIDCSTCLYSYRKNPHSDAREAAVSASTILDRLMEGEAVKQIHRGTKYVIPPTGLATTADPMKSVLSCARKIEAEDSDILCINVIGGYSFSDVKDCGFSINCCTKGDDIKAKFYLQQLVVEFEKHVAEAYPTEERLEQVLEQLHLNSDIKGPVLLVEPADNIGGGTPGDGTGLLSQLLAKGLSNIIAIINDPEAANYCHSQEIKKQITFLLGGKTDINHGRPIEFSGQIIHLSDGKFELENKKSHLASMMGSQINMGPSAVVKNCQATILITSQKTPPMDLGQLHSQNICPEVADFIVIKAAVSHKDAYDPIAWKSFNVDSIGLCSSHLESLSYRRLSGKQINNL